MGIKAVYLTILFQSGLMPVPTCAAWTSTRLASLEFTALSRFTSPFMVTYLCQFSLSATRGTSPKGSAQMQGF